MYYKKELRTQYTQFFSQIYFCDTSATSTRNNNDEVILPSNISDS